MGYLSRRIFGHNKEEKKKATPEEVERMRSFMILVVVGFQTHTILELQSLGIIKLGMMGYGLVMLSFPLLLMEALNLLNSFISDKKLQNKK